MKVLLDTHVFLWWVTNGPQLSSVARHIIGDGSNQIYLSAASAWEVAIKAATESCNCRSHRNPMSPAD